MSRLAVLVALALLLAGCGVGEGAGRGGGAELRITRDFGHERLAVERVAEVREGQTVMRLLSSTHDVATRFGGRFVQAIDGLEGDKSKRLDWFFWVNGIEAAVGAAEVELAPGDVVQWDYRSWRGAMRVPAIVGAFPEPFTSGLDGKKLPVRVECTDPAGDPCRTAKERLAAAGVHPTGAPLGAPASAEVLRVVVAPWSRARTLASIRIVGEGPARSGVFARFAAGGGRLVLLDGSGDPVRTAGPGSGLVAATSFAESKAVWVVTGVDDAGVLAAARALDAKVLRDAFAVAITPQGPVDLPVVGR